MEDILSRETFETTVQKSKLWVKEVMDEIGYPSESASLAAIRAVLHTLRDRLREEESAHLSAQLPMLLRGLYFEGWNPTHDSSRLRKREEFIEDIRKNLSGHPEINPESAAKAVFRVLSRKVSEGEVQDVKDNLNKELQELFPKTLQ